MNDRDRRRINARKKRKALGPKFFAIIPPDDYKGENQVGLADLKQGRGVRETKKMFTVKRNLR